LPTFTSSRYSVSAATLTANVTLSTFRAALLEHRPQHASLTAGWASVEDQGSNLRRSNVAPPVSDPEILPAEGQYPERLLARYYYFQQLPQLVQSLPDGTEQEHRVLEAVDVLISAFPDREHAFQILFATRNGSVLNGIVRDLRQIVRGLDEKGTLRLDGGANAFNPDLFLWLLVRARDDKQLDASTRISDVIAVNGRDNSHRGTFLSDGVDFDRPAFLVAVAEIDQLGPVRLELRDDSLNAKVTAEIYASGVFSVLKGQTHYPDIVSDPETRLKSVQDFAYNLLPKLRAIYGADTVWDTTRRAQEIRDAAYSLIARYEQKYKEFGPAS
jgi:hypothetical protein